MTREQFEEEVRRQINARKPPKYPDKHTIQTAVKFFNDDLGVPSASQCATLAIRLAHEYPQEPQDTGQPTTPPQERQVVIEAEVAVSSLIDQFRGRILGPEFALYWTGEEVQAYLASPSAGDTLVPFGQDIASATKTTVSAVAMAVLAGQPLALSAGNIGNVGYSVRMSKDDTEMLQWSTVELLTGNLPTHMVRDKWLPQMRQAAGHPPRQHIQTKGDQERDSALRTFVDAQKQEWGGCRGRVPNGFWASTFQAWNDQCERWERLQWSFPTKDALRIAYGRLLSQMPQGAPEKGLCEGRQCSQSHV